jgi:protein-L-isoaspartate(D-aspartate) O-methyltransferase
MAPDRADERKAMVAEQLAARGISDERVLAAMGSVPRELFVPESEQRLAYADSALGIEAAQTISQPWIVAAICQGLELVGSESVLEIGTGSGYSAAVLAELAERVVSIERIEILALGARRRLAALGIDAVDVLIGDGSLGCPERAPFDAIAVHAAVPRSPAALLDQLAPGGRLVAPVASAGEELLTRFRRPPSPAGDEGAEFVREPLAPCRFVPLIGAQGYPPQPGESG